MAGLDDGSVVLTGVGLVCPAGLTAAHSCAAIRARISRLTDYPLYSCIPKEDDSPENEAATSEDEVVKAGIVPLLPVDLLGPERLRKLALLALQRLVTEGRLERKDLRRAALLVALPLPDEIVSFWRLRELFVDGLCRQAGLEGWAEVDVAEGGPASVFRQMQAANEWLRARRVEFAVVLAVDSFIDVERLTLLDTAWRLLSARNVDGFLPGEAGAALLLEGPRAAKRRGSRVLARLGPSTFTSEPMPIGSEHWSSGAGLCAALRPLVSVSPKGTVGDWVLCDLNGESYRAIEWGLVQTRLARELPSLRRLVHPADLIGDAGTALAGVLAACAAQAFVRGYAPSASALLWAASDDGGRAALVLQAPSGNPISQ
jgi:3-oxoacyl-[acyl-carrier-protein] synthase-1